jgi:hypothetical protein
MPEENVTDKTVGISKGSESSALTTQVDWDRPTPSITASIEMQGLVSQALKVEMDAGNPVVDKILVIYNRRLDDERFFKQQDQDLRKQQQDRLDRESERQHELALKKLAQSDRSDQSLNSNLRLAIGAVCGVLLSTMVYSGITKDSAFSNQLITGVFGLLGGGGVTSALTKKDKPADPKP